MTPTDFCYWLQGYFELSRAESMTDGQLKIVKEHLALVFEHTIDPVREARVAAEEVKDDAPPIVGYETVPGNPPIPIPKVQKYTPGRRIC